MMFSLKMCYKEYYFRHKDFKILGGIFKIYNFLRKISRNKKYELISHLCPHCILCDISVDYNRVMISHLCPRILCDISVDYNRVMIPNGVIMNSLELFML